MAEEKNPFLGIIAEAVNMWRNVTSKSKKSRPRVDSGIAEQLKALKQDMQAYRSIVAEQLGDSALDTTDLRKTILNNPDKFSREEVRTLLQLQRMREEVVAVRDELGKIMKDGKRPKAKAEVKGVSELSQGSGKDESEEAATQRKKDAAKRARRMQKKFRNKGGGDGWIPM